MKSRIASGSTENYKIENYPHRLSALSDSSEREQCFLASSLEHGTTTVVLGGFVRLP